MLLKDQKIKKEGTTSLDSGFRTICKNLMLTKFFTLISKNEEERFI